MKACGGPGEAIPVGGWSGKGRGDGSEPVGVWITPEMDALGDTDFPRLIMSRAGLTPAHDIINLGICFLVRDAPMGRDQKRRR